MRNSFSPGQTLRFVAADDVAAGDIVTINDVVGVAPNDVASGAVGLASINSAFNLPKHADEVVDSGEYVFLSGTSVTATNPAGTFVGYTLEPAGSGTTSVPVYLVGARGPQGISGTSGATGGG